MSPLERARRTRAYNIFNQTYLNKSGINVFFLKELRKNPCLLLEQCHRSNAVLKVLSETQYGIVKRFMVNPNTNFGFSHIIIVFTFVLTENVAHTNATLLC